MTRHTIVAFHIPALPIPDQTVTLSGRLLLRYAMVKIGSLDSCSAILSGLAKRLGLESRLLELRLQHQWSDIIGEPIASQTWPAHIRFKKLYLTVTNSVWLQQLTFLKPSLLAKLHETAGKSQIDDIVLRVGEVPVSTNTLPSVVSADATRSESEIHLEIDPHTAGIQDPDLRKRFTSAIARYPSPRTLPRPAKDPSRGL